MSEQVASTSRANTVGNLVNKKQAKRESEPLTLLKHP
jgi:hypothetical protein